MATLTIRNLPDDVRDRLRIRAAENGRSMEAEAREVLASSVPRGVSKLSKTELDKRVREAQDYISQFIAPGSYSTDDFLRERREEDAAVQARFDRLAHEGRSARR